MNPLYIIAIPLALVIIGMILNSTGLAYDQPPSSQEQDPSCCLGHLQRDAVWHCSERGPVFLPLARHYSFQIDNPAAYRFLKITIV
jgi:hypothetical protein